MSNHKPYLIIGDIHHRIYLAEQIASKYDDTHTIIFLGDYFDAWDDTPKDAERTASWLKQSLYKPNRIHLAGNHDLTLIFPFHASLRCAGWTKDKNRAVRTILDQKELDQLKLYHYIKEGNWLLSHAGFTLANLYGFKHPNLANKGLSHAMIADFAHEVLLNDIKRETYKFSQAAQNNHYHHFMFCGSRCGEAGNGGPYWLHQDDFIPIIHFNQIFGHTYNKTPHCWYVPNKLNPTSTNWNIDTCNQHVAFIENGQIRIEETKNII